MPGDGTEFDYIVCGAGASGSVLARRLADNPDIQVLLIEAGGNDQSELVQDPRRALGNLGSERDWQYVMQPNAALAGSRLPLPAGKGLGGGTSINFMYWTRGHREDWDFFAAVSGEPAWNAASIEYVFDRIEDRTGADAASPSSGGMVPITRDALSAPLLEAASTAFSENGSARYDEINGTLLQHPEGHGPRERNILRGRRISAFEAYIRPRLGHAGNLHVVNDCFILRVNVENKQAVGVSVLIGNDVVELHARCETILCTGAIQTPKILMLSGIGPRRELEHHDIPVRHHLPGVGLGFQDHVLLQGCNWLSRPAADEEPTTGGIVGYAKSGASLAASDLQFVFTGFMVANDQIAARFDYPEGSYQYRQGWGISVGLLRPFSSGTVRLADANPLSHPLIDPRMLSDPRDEQALLDGIALARSIGNSVNLKPFAARELSPGDLSAEGMKDFLRQAVGTYFHPSASARMGTDDLSVVDGRLKVHGLERLRIADASIMPRVPAANTMAPSIAIGELASDFVMAAHGR
jgi:choline dehydrogenase